MISIPIWLFVILCVLAGITALGIILILVNIVIIILTPMPEPDIPDCPEFVEPADQSDNPEYIPPVSREDWYEGNQLFQIKILG